MTYPTGYWPAAPRSAHMIVLTLEWAGRTWRWGEYAVAGVCWGGSPVDTAERSISLFRRSGASQSIPVRGVQLDVDVAELIERGHRFEGSRCEIAAWDPDDDWERRIVLMTGTASTVDYGAVGEPVSWTIQGDGGRDDGLYPERMPTIQRGDFASIDEAGEGAPRPLVIGRPGIQGIDSAGSYWVAGSSPCQQFQGGGMTGAAIIAQGHVEASSVRICDADNADSYVANVIRARDAQGLPYSSVIWSSGDLSTAFGLERTIAWDQGGGGTEPRGLGDLCIRVLQHSRARIDWPAWEAVRSSLNRYAIDTYIDRQVSPLEWVSTQLLQVAPVSLRTGPRGVQPVLWRWDATPGDAVAHIRGLSRDGQVQYDRTSPVNHWVVRWGRRYDGVYQYTHTLTGLPPSSRDRDMSGTVDSLPILRASYGYYGQRGGDVISLDHVQDRYTATAAVRWRAIAHAFPHRIVTYTDPERVHADLRPGNPVLITDEELHWSSRLAWVDGLRWSQRMLSLTLRIIETPGAGHGAQ